MSTPEHTRTFDSRFQRHRSADGEVVAYDMYMRNLVVEGDGLAYPELNLLRTLLLHPLFLTILGCNMLLEYNPYSLRPFVLFAHTIGFVANLLRLMISAAILLVEVAVLVPRLVVCTLLTPLAFPLSLGHMYALPCAACHIALRGAGAVVVRVVHLARVHDPAMTVHERFAGLFGRVQCFRMSSARQASYLAAAFNVRQRAGFGPEVLWVRGASVFVSDWTPISMSALIGRWVRQQHAEVWATWKLLDIKTMEWRRVIVTADMDFSKQRNKVRRLHGSSVAASGTAPSTNATKSKREAAQLQPGQTLHDRHDEGEDPELASGTDIETGHGLATEVIRQERLLAEYNDEHGPDPGDTIGRAESRPLYGGMADSLGEQYKDICGSLAARLSVEHLGTMRSLSDLSSLYESARGWNKHHLMRLHGAQVALTRGDRRLFGHVLAALSTGLTYLQFRDPTLDTHAVLKLSVELYGVLIANYAFITAYAAQVVIGPVHDVVDVGSERYGVIATRAIDRGFVRGLHVRHGGWLLYENGEDDGRPVHAVSRAEVNLTCNSVVRETERGPVVRVIGYESLQGQQHTDTMRYGYSFTEMQWVD